MQQLWNSAVIQWIQNNAEFWQKCSSTELFTILTPLTTGNTLAPSTQVTFFHCGYLQHRVTYLAWVNQLTVWPNEAKLLVSRSITQNVGTLTWLIADISWLPCHLPAQQQRYLSGIHTIFQMVPDTGRAAG